MLIEDNERNMIAVAIIAIDIAIIRGSAILRAIAKAIGTDTPKRNTGREDSNPALAEDNDKSFWI